MNDQFVPDGLLTMLFKKIILNKHLYYIVYNYSLRLIDK